MKSILFILLIGVSGITFSQSDTVTLIRTVDDMSGDIYIYPSRGIVLSEIDGSKGMRLDLYINAKCEVGFLVAKTVGVGNCQENNEIILLFESGEKITVKSWNKFNCKGDSFFQLTKGQLETLRTQVLVKARISNGRSYESYTSEVPEKDRKYFIQLIYLVDNKLFTDKKE